MQTKAQKKRAIEAKKRNTVKSGKYKGWNVEITKTSNGKKCNMCGKNYHDFGDYSGYCPKCAKGFYKELQDDMDSQDEHDAKIQKLKEWLSYNDLDVSLDNKGLKKWIDENPRTFKAIENGLRDEN